jgi:hypothetical protein
MSPLVSLIFLFISIVAAAQSFATIYNYNKTKQAKDLSFYWACVVMFVGVIGIITSAWMLATTSGAGGGGGGGGGGTENVLKSAAAQARNVAEAANAQAAAATNAAKAVQLAKGAGVSI